MQQQTHHGAGAASALAPHLRRLGGRAPLVLCGPSRRFVDAVVAGLGGDARVFDGARVHVPVETVDAAEAALDGCDALVAVGGGAAIGLAKALRLRRALPCIAVPTTFAGSEATSIWGVRSGGRKQTGRDPRVRPEVAVYDPRLTLQLPLDLAVQSLVNAMAHPVAALEMADAEHRPRLARVAAAVHHAALGLLRCPHLEAAHEAAQRAARAAAEVLEAHGAGPHHRVAHALGGHFDLAHAPLHAALLPHTIAGLAETVSDAFRTPDPAGEVHDLLVAAGAATALSTFGLSGDAAAVAGDPDWFEPALAGRRPTARAPGPPLPEFGAAPVAWGFGGHHASEALPGALPIGLNSPRQAPYGLYAEQVNGTGFVAPRHHNRRAWLYRIRPAAGHRPFQRLAHPTFAGTFVGRPPTIDLAGWAPLPAPETSTDFVDGLRTLGGAGDPGLRRGYAVHRYHANRDMVDRAFYDADGDLVLLPEQGRLRLLTEMGVLDVAPGELAAVPAGVRFSVRLPDGRGRGYAAEAFGRHFELPERGPVGANGLVDERDIRVPTAWYEDRSAPGFRLTARLGGALYEATQDHSPFDVVAWRGTLTPYAYDLSRFSPVGNTRVDHGDPSVYTVLTAPLDEIGAHTLDLVVFPPRWDATEGTFRPPFLHRNVTTEINGVVRAPGGSGPFPPGCAFITPSYTAHQVRAGAVHQAITAEDEVADRPQRHGADSLWFQFETALPMVLTPDAEATARADWPLVWQTLQSRFDPRGRPAPPA